IKTKQILKVMWKHVSRYSLAFFVIMLGIAAAKIVDVIVPIYFKRFFDLLSGDVEYAGTLTDELVQVIIMVALLHSFGWLMWRISLFINSWFQTRVMADIVQTGHEYLLQHSYRFFSNAFTGSLVRKVNRLARAFEKLADQMQFKFLPVTVIGIGNLIVLWTRSPVLGITLLIWLVLYLIVNIWFSSWKTKFDYKSSKADSKATGVLADGITNANTIKLFTGLEHEKKLYKEATEEQRRLRRFSWNLGEGLDAIQGMMMIIIEFLIMYFAIELYLQGELTIGDFALIQGYLISFFMILWDIGRAVRHVFEALADADEMVEILNTPHEVQDARNAKELQVQNAGITFENVYFSYSKTRRILKGLNLTIKPKEKVALVGPSGAGKSTITKLLFRFYDLERGKIRIDDQRINKVTQESLRANLALVPQEPILFHRSIMENIRYSRRGATDEEVMEAAKKAHAHEFIKNLAQGYDTLVGERGVKLSGGERQRVAIARAILKDAPILVLDEATSSLDSESEALIQDALEKLMKDKTTIVIAHRLSTIMKMDRIIVVEDGQVSMTGTHKQLLRRKDNIYKKLWEIQAGGFQE
ncbi:MAG: ABC transporter ATP-binding protein, partial [bacterium]|nr:ABC transporter ATP-binding protein [bacterium]